MAQEVDKRDGFAARRSGRVLVDLLKADGKGWAQRSAALWGGRGKFSGPTPVQLLEAGVQGLDR